MPRKTIKFPQYLVIKLDEIGDFQPISDPLELYTNLEEATNEWEACVHSDEESVFYLLKIVKASQSYERLSDRQREKLSDY